MKILVVDDERTLREGCAAALQAEGYEVTALGRGDEALQLVSRRRFDIILLDQYLTPVPGMDILKAALATHRETIVIVMTGNASVTSSLEALRAGAWDYLPKPFAASHLQVLIGRAAHAIASARTARACDDMVETKGAGGSMVLLGNSPALRKAIELARKVAATDASVMITGESGTGKEVIAQFIHAHSRRARHELVAVNCAAIPEQLLESEMFGHRRGAFTGADRDKPGLLETAHQGTLFLDELTEMPLSLQPKLLRVIQDGVVRRVGSETRDAVVDVRFISATNRDPHEVVASGILRQDLFYRLRVVPIELPPLRKRTEDIALLAQHFLESYWSNHRSPNDPLPRFTERSFEFLRSLPWRGNVRELQNVIEHLAVLAEPNQTIGPDEIPVQVEQVVGRSEASGFADLMDESFQTARAHFEREYLTRLVARANGNMSRAARLASIDRTTLYRLMDKHNHGRANSADETA